MPALVVVLFATGWTRASAEAPTIAVAGSETCLGVVTFDNAHGIFAGNAALRRAVNWALDRKVLAAAAPGYAAKPWTHILSPLTPGSMANSRLQPYGVRANIAKARELARGHLRTGHVVVVYASSAVAQVQRVVASLVQLGIGRERIILRAVVGPELYDFIASSRAWDLAVGVSWCSDLSVWGDPANQLADVLGSHDSPWSVRSTKYERRLAAVRRLTGAARSRALWKLDFDVMRALAPIAPIQAAVGSSPR